MKANKFFLVLAVLMVASLVLAACQPAATPTPQQPPAQQPTTPPEQPPAEQPTTPPQAGFEPMVYGVETCDNYNGIIKEIAALDELTVRFTLCVPDPAFESKAAFSAFAIQPKEWIEAAMANKQILENPSALARMYWIRGNAVTASSSNVLMITGARKPKPKPWFSAGHPKAPPACWNCNPVRLTELTTPAQTTSRSSGVTPTCN